MSFFSKFFIKSTNTVEALSRPWDQNKKSLYSFILAHIDENGKMKEEGHSLPDEKKKDGLSFAPGMLDGIMSVHHEGYDGSEKAAQILDCIKVLINDLTDRNFAVLYEILLENNTLDYIQALAKLLPQFSATDGKQIGILAHILAIEAPDREAVKFGLAILGLFDDQRFIDVFMTFGRHDEFTIFSAVGIANTFDNFEPLLWELAKSVDGWGKIQLVYRLAKTENRDIKKWMLIDGYRNSVMNEYLALTCAHYGELHNALDSLEVEDSLFHGASAIIEALLTQEGPAGNIDSYEYSASVLKNYMIHAEKRTLSMFDLLAIKKIKEYIHEHVDVGKNGWNDEILKEIKQKVEKILSRSEWREKILSDLKSKESHIFYLAAQVAEGFDIDTWQYHYDRFLGNSEDSDWGHLLDTQDPKKIDKVLALAQKRLPLAKVGLGPALDSGFGQDMNLFMTMQLFAQTLENFPGKGFFIIEALLKSPIISLRDKAIKVLSVWGKNSWPEGMLDLVNQAYEIEPDKKVKQKIAALLKGEKIKEQQAAL